jgi:membrane peptidoglycan carboxypeptidase
MSEEQPFLPEPLPDTPSSSEDNHLRERNIAHLSFEDEMLMLENVARNGNKPYIFPSPSSNNRSLYALDRLRHRRMKFTLYIRRMRRHSREEESKTRSFAIGITLFTIFLIMTMVVGGSLNWVFNYYQQTADLRNGIQTIVNDDSSIRIYDMHGTLLYQFNDAGIKHNICYNQMPRNIQNATVAIEDKSFWTNDGVDYQRILSAAIQNYNSQSIQQGASTITQQLIKNTLLDSSTTFKRKLQEAILAFGITATKEYSKQQIMEMYLNTISYGPTIYGIDAAAQSYFGYHDDPSINLNCDIPNHNGKTAAEYLTLAQASFLAGIPQNPNTYNPLTVDGYKSALARQKQVLDAMREQGYITRAQSDAAWKESHSPGFLNLAPSIPNLAPHFVEYIRDQLSQMIDTDKLSLSRTGINVYTTLDLPLQNRVQQYMKQHLFGNEIDEYGTYYKYDNASQSAALLAQTGTNDIRVMLGSWDYYATKTPLGKPVKGQVNVLTQSYRQVGSTFKAILYTAAFEKGWFPAMTIADDPTIFPVGKSGTYKPLDAERTIFADQITVRQALQYSLNIPAIKTTEFVGISDLKNMMTRMGITDYQGTPNLAMGIGSLDIHVIDLIHAYSVLANYGRSLPFNAIDHITDSQGKSLYVYDQPKGTQVIDPGVAYLTTSVLSDNPSRASHFGICSPLRVYTNTWEQCVAGKPGIDYVVAAKTGTTDNLTNDLAAGYTTDYIGGVWVGNTNGNDSMHHISGISGAAPIWNKMMLMAEGCQTVSTGQQYRSAHYGGGVDTTGCKPAQAFPVPSNVTRGTFTSNGITSTDWFLVGNVPKTQNIGNGGPALRICKFNDNTLQWSYCPPSNSPKDLLPTKGNR